MADTMTESSRQADLDDPGLYLNREMSLLDYHRRLNAQAADDAVPLLERVRFLSMCSASLDEFFEIRMGGLKEQVALGISNPGPDGLGPAETIRQVRGVVEELVREQYRLLNDDLLPALADRGIRILERSVWTEPQQEWVRGYFQQEVLPVITPVGLDPAHPFPRVLNKSLNFSVSLTGKDAYGRQSRVAVVQVPRILPRLIPMPAEVGGAGRGFVLLSSVIHRHVADLFVGMNVTGCHQFRVTRNSDLWVDEEETQDLLHALKGELPSRHYGKAVRLEISDACPEDMAAFLLGQFDLASEDVYRVQGPVNLHRLETLFDLVDEPHLKYVPFVPGLPRKVQREPDVFALLRSRDVLLHHPYESPSPIVQLVRQAARDPAVLAIKQTLYRTELDSPYEEALCEAARAGKEVTAVIELRARFSEATNIELATRLQEAGVKVVYGVVGFKAHAKMILVVRREEGEVRRYVHLGTGDYSMRMARTYTDFSYLTSDEAIGRDVHSLFLQLTGLCRHGKLEKLVQAPFGFHARMLELIEAETANARNGGKARITAKMNTLLERKLIRALYEASRAGVEIELVVRKACGLRPGVPGVSERIRVRSVLGRFLEHHRIFHFHANGDEITLCSTGDWMSRNLFRRVEVCFPILGKSHRGRVVREGLEAYLGDDVLAWTMRPDGSWAAPPAGAVDPQQSHLEAFARKAV